MTPTTPSPTRESGPARTEEGPGEAVFFPTSFAQQRLWFLHHLDPGGSTYNLSIAVRLEGALDAAILEGSLNEIVRRHDVLRTSFPVRYGVPVQVIAPCMKTELKTTDLRDLPAESREREVARLAAAEVNRAFDLAAGPLFRSRLLRPAERDHVLVLTMHHIISDGWSLDVLRRELATLYEAFRDGKPSPLPDLPIQYADYALSEREWLRGDVLDSHLAYWKQQLLGIPALLELPSDFPRSAVQTTRGATETTCLPADLVAGLEALARREGATLFTTLLAAFQALLHRYTGQEQIAVGSPIAGRTQVETEGLIGFFVNTLVLRGDFSLNPTFRQLLARARETTLGAHAHQDLPFEKLVEELRPARALSHTPLFQVMLQFIAPSDAPFTLAGLRAEPFRIGVEEEDGRGQSGGVSQFDLTLRVAAGRDSLRCDVDYNRDLFSSERILRLLDHWQTLLWGIVRDPDALVSELPLLAAAERRRLLFESNAVGAPGQGARVVTVWIEEQAERTPAAVALVSGDERLTYGELNGRANRLARYLSKRGVGPEAPVGLCVERSVEMVVGLLGILKAGGAYVPLDPRYPRERLAYMLEDSGASVLLTQRSLAGALPESAVERVYLDEDWPRIEEESAGNLEKGGAGPDNLAYVIYTSGSTGKPKGVEIPHRALANYVEAVSSLYATTPSDRVLQFSSLSFDSAADEIFIPLAAGAGVVLRSEEMLRSAGAFLEACQRSGVTVLIFPTAFWHELVAGMSAGGLRFPDSIRLVCFGGEKASPERLTQWRELAGDRVRLWNGYGPTEATIAATFCDLTEWLEQTPALATVPIGRPIANVRVYVLDRRGQLRPEGLTGELYIGGAGLARGYRNLADETDRRFVPSPLPENRGERLYRTGDSVRYGYDGHLEFLGRLDDQVKIRGFRVELEEIESVLTRHPQVRDAVVLAREDAPGQRRLVAYVVGETEDPSASELRAFLAGKLPEYMVPAVFVPRKSFPRTPSGKVDRRSLPAPERGTLAPRGGEAPRDALEAQIAGIWEKALGVPVGRTDDFFDLGGHSLLAVRVFSQIEKATGKQLPLVTLFQAPTVTQLADALRNRGWEPLWSSLVPIQSQGSKPPFYCVHAVGGNVLTYFDLARHLGPTQPVYGLQAQGLDGKKAPHETVEEMAAYYLREIRQFQPEGPYFLGGSSAGGLVAFEMARQLHAQGQEVGVLALFDTWGPDYPRVIVGMSPLRLRRARFLERVDLHLGNFLVAEGSSGKLDYVLTKSHRLRLTLGQKGRRYWRRIEKALNPLPAALRRVEKKSRRAIDVYVPQQYPGRVTLFRATKQPSGIYPDSELGWSRVAGGGVEVHEVPGYHGAIVYEPRIKILAQQLRECLDKAYQDRPAGEGGPPFPEASHPLSRTVGSS